MTRGGSEVVIDERDECEAEGVEELRARTAPHHRCRDRSMC